MSYINTEQLRDLVDAGHQLAPGTIRTLLATIDDYQKYPRTAGPGLTPPRPLDPDQKILANQYAWTPEFWDYGLESPIFTIIRQLSDNLERYARNHQLTVDPASIRIEFDDHGNGQATSRLVAFGKPKDKK